MSLIRVPQNFGVGYARNNIREALTTLGEEVILLRMYHVNDDAGTHPRCSVCWNDVYAHVADTNCETCLGTTFEGGVKEAWRVWAIIDDQTQDEKIDKGGVWGNADHQIQTEPFPELQQRDYLVRVSQWDNTKQAPLKLESRYRIGPVKPISVRTGARFGMTNADRVAQTTNAVLMPKTEVIYKYDILTEISFPRYDSQAR